MALLKPNNDSYLTGEGSLALLFFFLIELGTTEFQARGAGSMLGQQPVVPPTGCRSGGQELPGQGGELNYGLRVMENYQRIKSFSF